MCLKKKEGLGLPEVGQILLYDNLYFNAFG